jgi:hypothetical protein
MLAAGFAGFTQIEEHARCTVDAMAGGKRGTDQSQQSSILLRSIRHRLLQPTVVAAARDTQDTAHHFDAEFVAMRLDERVRYANAPSVFPVGHRLASGSCHMLFPVHKILGTPKALVELFAR